ncbi:hypothetical protein [Prochlorococcus sp. MIT 0916]
MPWYKDFGNDVEVIPVLSEENILLFIKS